MAMLEQFEIEANYSPSMFFGVDVDLELPIFLGLVALAYSPWLSKFSFTPFAFSAVYALSSNRVQVTLLGFSFACDKET